MKTNNSYLEFVFYLVYLFALESSKYIKIINMLILSITVNLKRKKLYYRYMKS